MNTNKETRIKANMKILFPLEIFYPASVGGPSATLYWHTGYLARNGVEVFVVATDYQLDSAHCDVVKNKWEKRNGCNVIFCKTKFRFFPVRAMWETLKCILKCDAIHYSSAYFCISVYTLVLSVLFGKRVFFSPRGELFPTAINRRDKKIILMFYKLISSRVTFHATSDAEVQTILNIYPKAHVIKQPNFIETNVADPPGARSKDIVFLGIIGGIKKIENLIQAVALSKVLMNGTSRLNIVGAPRTVRDVGYMDSLVALVKELKLEDKVNFLGAKFEREKEKILNDSYVLVLPSASENFGNVVVEAMAQSTPVIASTNTPWEILHDYNAGWWVDNSPASLAKTLDIALSLESAQYQAICRNAQRLLKEKYLIDTSKDNHWLHIYTNDDVQKDCDLS